MGLLTLRLFHILFMTTWFGAAIFVSGDTRRSLAEPTSNGALLAGRLRRSGRIAAVSGLLTLVTGFALIFALGGFANVSVAIHIAIGTAVAAMIVGGAVIGRNAAKIADGLENGADRASLQPAAKQLTIGVAIFHSLWALTLVLMVFRTLF